VPLAKGIGNGYVEYHKYEGRAVKRIICISNNFKEEVYDAI